jgi:site-specific DNA recombinase
MMSASNKAVILARVSSKGQEEEGYSLDSQVKLLRSYCDNKGFFVAETFKIAESATKASQRRTFNEAMKFIEDNEIKHLIIEKVDRHVRNLHDAVATHDWLMADEERHVHFVKDSLIMHKNSRSQEWLNWGIRVVMAKNYVDNLREEAMKGWAEKLAQGWLPSSPPPGYMTVTENGKRIHVPDPVTSKLMLKVFKFYLSPGESLDLAGALGFEPRIF